MEGLSVPFKAIKEGLENIINFFKELISYINPFDQNFFVYKLIELLGNLLKWLFVPEQSSFEDLQEKFNTKFAFVNQIKQMFSNLLGFNDYSETLPTFSINYEGQNLNIIDFSLFTNYRVWLHGIILSIAWFCYIRKLYNKLPQLIGGV